MVPEPPWLRWLLLLLLQMTVAHARDKHSLPQICQSSQHYDFRSFASAVAPYRPLLGKSIIAPTKGRIGPVAGAWHGHDYDSRALLLFY